MRVRMQSELGTPFIALLVVLLAAVAGLPGILALLAPLWLLPVALAGRSVGALDEREIGLRERAERYALRALLLCVCALPILGGERAGAGMALLRQEWVDGGLLLVAAFVFRALIFASGALSPGAAAHYAGALAAAMAGMWVVALTLFRSGSVSILLALAALPLVPHLVRPRHQRLAGALWLAGAVAVGVHAWGTGMVPIELAVIAALFVIPWTAAGWWSLRLHPA